MSREIYATNYLDFYDPVKCIGDLGEKWCNFKWRIYNLQLNPQETFQSPVFTTRLLPKTFWYLRIKLSSPGNLRSMKISLCRLQNDEDVVSIVDVIYEVICNEETMISDKSTFVYNNKTSLNDRFYTAAIHRSKDYITVTCKLRPNKIMIQNVRHGNCDETLPIHLRKLLQSGEVFDTFIQVGNQQLKAHLAIIYARLPNLLNPSPIISEGKNIIKINDLPISLVKEMLKYAYTGQAYLDFDFVSAYKDILVEKSNNFFQRCNWEDGPFATTFFNYETDSLLWNLKRVCTQSNLGKHQIELLRLYPNKLELWLDVVESEFEKKHLVLTFKFCNEEMPKPTIVSCKYSLVDEESQNTFELGETETLLSFKSTQGKVKLCSLFEIMRGKSTLCAREEFLVLKTDFKFCYGSSKSSIENLYEGQFDISQCTSCALLSADMEYLNFVVSHWDIILESKDGSEISAHKAILIARWKEAENFQVKEKSRIKLDDLDFQDLCKLRRQLYTGKTFK